jgi:hypothetical protein
VVAARPDGLRGSQVPQDPADSTFLGWEPST